MQIDWVRRLPLTEQVIQYNRYLEDISTQRMVAELGAAGGTVDTEPIPEPTPPEVDDYLVTEDENKLITQNDNFIILEQ